MGEGAKIDAGRFRVGRVPGSAGKKGPAGTIQINSKQLMEKEFHRRFGVFIRSSPGLVDEATRELRIRLIREELGEFEKAANDKNLVKIADALADLLYVIYGTGVSYGIDLEPIFKELHESNMSKGDPDVLRSSTGKILKAKNWKPPDLQPILEKM